MSDTFKFTRGRSPVLVSIPHAGTLLPLGMAARLSPAAASLPDTDWFVDRLYDMVGDLGAGLIVARYSRYVIDLNRPPDDAALYRQETPGLVPVRTFSGQPVYRGARPDEDEAGQLIQRYWQPYHQAIGGELQRLRNEHGFAVLFDAHSIRSHVPDLFEGRLPDLNLGTNDGRSTSPALVSLVAERLGRESRYSHVIDGRFKGGYITRQYGRPNENLHALQLEMSQAVYMQEDPPEYNHAMAGPVKEMLEELLAGIAEWRPDGA